MDRLPEGFYSKVRKHLMDKDLPDRLVYNAENEMIIATDGNGFDPNGRYRLVHARAAVVSAIRDLVPAVREWTETEGYVHHWLSCLADEIERNTDA